MWYTESVVGAAYNWQPPALSNLHDADSSPFPAVLPLVNGMYIGHAIITNYLLERSRTNIAGRESYRESGQGEVTFYGTEPERRSWDAHRIDPNAGSFGSGTGFSIGSRPVGYAQLQALPRTAGALLTVIRRRVNAPFSKTAPAQPTGDVVQALATLLTEPIPSAARAAAFRALASTPHVRDLGLTDDLLGRSGIGIAYDTTAHNTFFNSHLDRTLKLADGHIRTELIFSSDSGTLLAYEQIWENPPSRFGLPRSLPVNWQAYLSGKVVKAPASLTFPAGR